MELDQAHVSQGEELPGQDHALPTPQGMDVDGQDKSGVDSTSPHTPRTLAVNVPATAHSADS
jgi:hypothetical protein